MKLLSALTSINGRGGTVFRKEVGKGGGGSTEEPTVCMLLVPLAMGLAWSIFDSLRRRAARPAAAA